VLATCCGEAGARRPHRSDLLSPAAAEERVGPAIHSDASSHFVMPGLVPRIHPTASANARLCMDSGDKRRNDMLMI